MPDDRPQLIVLLGPTAGGKSDLAAGLAESLDGEIIGADSMQVYRHLDAGTAKPDASLRARAPHHLIDLVEPTERFTVHDWLQQAEACIESCHARGKRPIVVGGTNLYIKALLEGLFDGPGQDAAYRDSLDAVETGELHRQLTEVDPESAQRIKPADRKRIVRALEVFHVTGEPISAHQTQWSERSDTYRYDAVMIGLHWAPEDINPRINLRVKAMFYPHKVDPEVAQAVCIGGEDLVAETRRLEAAGLLGAQAREALGYKQVLACLQGEMTEGEAFERTKVLTRRFAKQQRTWLKRFAGVRWIQAAKLASDELLRRAEALIPDR